MLKFIDKYTAFVVSKIDKCHDWLDLLIRRTESKSLAFIMSFLFFTASLTCIVLCSPIFIWVLSRDLNIQEEPSLILKCSDFDWKKEGF